MQLSFENNLKIFCLRLLRPEVLLASVLWEDTTAITQAKQLLQNYLNNSSAVISPNLREVKTIFNHFEEQNADMAVSLIFRLFTLVPSYPENINIGNFAGLNIQLYEVLQKHQLKDYSCLEP